MKSTQPKMPYGWKERCNTGLSFTAYIAFHQHRNVKTQPTGFPKEPSASLSCHPALLFVYPTPVFYFLPMPYLQRRQWQPTPVLLPGESQAQRSLVVCCLWGCTESDTTKWLSSSNLYCVNFIISPAVRTQNSLPILKIPPFLTRAVQDMVRSLDSIPSTMKS